MCKASEGIVSQQLVEREVGRVAAGNVTKYNSAASGVN
jgi:hypothetical protein